MPPRPASRRGRAARRALAAAAVLLLGAGPAPLAAEMYRCPGPDGGTLFTSDASQCPGAAPFEPEREVQRADPGAPPPRASGPAGRARPVPAGIDEAARAARWRAKRREAEARLAEVTAAIDHVAQGVTWCNQGRELWTTDPDTGLREEISCDALRTEHAQLLAAREHLDAYLHDGGLEDECRRAGCLPGWIR